MTILPEDQAREIITAMVVRPRHQTTRGIE